ncbi:class I SAM-dependent methyltransferase [Kiritimatiellota bacterium B12222]|nr:class I SAM-dependent methyltransferase [Kiritimatiellota bacterium B12222]
MPFNKDVTHLPYDLKKTTSRTEFYETLWKTKGLQLLEQQLANTQGLRLLDYGCGRGEFFAMAETLGFNAEGCDPDPVCVQISSDLGPCRLLDDNSLDTHYEKKSFDVISCFHVLEHVDAPLQLIENLRDLSNGYLLLAVPNLRVLKYFSYKPQPDTLTVNEGHLQGWDHQTFLNLCINHAGLEFVAWAHDTTVLPICSPSIQKLFGFKSAMRLETGIFLKMFPYFCNSIIGLFKCPKT